MKKANRSLFLFLMIVFIMTIPVDAYGMASVTIKTRFRNESRQYRCWNISPRTPGEWVDTMSIEELDSEFPVSSTSTVSDEMGNSYITNLEEGIYYAMEIDKTDGSRKSTTLPFYFEIETENQHVSIEPKESPSSLMTGGIRFRKISEESGEIGLPGASFRIYSKDGQGKMNTVQKNGKDIILKSGENGYFRITDIPIGNYYLVETGAPVYKGVRYILNPTPILFSVTPFSLNEDVLVIVNEPALSQNPVTIPYPAFPTPPIGNNLRLPYTGVEESWLWLIGLIILAIGMLILGGKSNQKKKKK